MNWFFALLVLNDVTKPHILLPSADYYKHITRILVFSPEIFYTRQSPYSFSMAENMKFILDALFCWENGEYSGMFDFMQIISHKLDAAISHLQLDVTHDIFTDQTITADHKWNNGAKLWELLSELKISLYGGSLCGRNDNSALILPLDCQKKIARAENWNKIEELSFSLRNVGKSVECGDEKSESANGFEGFPIPDNKNSSATYNPVCTQTLLSLLDTSMTVNLMRRKHAFWHTLKNLKKAEYQIHWSNVKPAMLHPILEAKTVGPREKVSSALRKLAERLTSLIFKAEAIILLNRAKRSAFKFKSIDKNMANVFEQNSCRPSQQQELLEIWKAKTEAEEIISFGILKSKEIHYEADRWSGFTALADSYCCPNRMSKSFYGSQP